jgi:hypothetical protein
VPFNPGLNPVSPSQATSANESNGQVGNLQLNSQQKVDLVNFLKILSDGYSMGSPQFFKSEWKDVMKQRLPRLQPESEAEPTQFSRGS